MAEITVRLAAQADIREAALWYDAQRPGLGTEFTLQLAPFWNASRRIHFNFPRLEAVYDAHFFSGSRTRFTSLLQPRRL